jgi:hypothetical protein
LNYFFKIEMSAFTFLPRMAAEAEEQQHLKTPTAMVSAM